MGVCACLLAIKVMGTVYALSNNPKKLKGLRKAIVNITYGAFFKREYIDFFFSFSSVSSLFPFSLRFFIYSTFQLGRKWWDPKWWGWWE